MTDQNVLSIDEKMTLEDCAFLRSVYLPGEKDSTVLDLTSLSKADVHDFAIAFKVLDGKSICTM